MSTFAIVIACAFCTGAKLKQKHSLVVEPAASLDIHVDEELAHQPSRRRAKPDAEAAPSLRLRLDAPDLEEHLQHDPLRLHKVCCSSHSCHSPYCKQRLSNCAAFPLIILTMW